MKADRSRYGKVLFDGRGRALYLFTREAAHAPLLRRLRPRLAAPADQGQAARPQGVEEFGGHWYVLSPGGRAVL